MSSRWWFLDLLSIVLYAAGVGFAVHAGLGGALRVALVVPLIVFLPGYALVSALFPRHGATATIPAFDDESRGASPPTHYAVDGVERFTLSVVLSIAVSPLVAAVANFTPWGIRLPVLLGGLLAVTVGFAVVAFVHRLLADPAERFAPSAGAVRRTFLTPASGRNADTSADALLGVLLVVSMLLVVASGGYAATQTPATEPFSEFYLVTNDGENGSTPSYATNLTRGQTQPYTLAITNQEGERTEYTVVAELRRVDRTGGETVVEERQQVARFSEAVDAGDTVTQTVGVTPEMSGDDLRVVFLLYEGSPEGDPYRVVSMPVSVADGSSNDLAPPGAAADG